MQRFMVWIILLLFGFSWPTFAQNIDGQLGGAYLSKVYATDPDTGTAWTLSGVDALELGGIETTAVLSWLMDVQAYVDYTPAASASGGCRMMLCGVGQ